MIERADYANLTTLWRGLLDGNIRVSRAWSDAQCASLRIESIARPLGNVSTRSAEILERVWLGEIPKHLASDRGVACSTIATRCSSILRAIGCSENPSHASILLVMAVHAARGIQVPQADVSRSWTTGDALTISVPIPNPDLRGRLSHCEAQVARLAIAGKSHAEIAQTRNTALRTVANQMAAIFRKLGISGRGEMRTTAVRGLAGEATPGNPGAREGQSSVVAKQAPVLSPLGWQAQDAVW